MSMKGFVKNASPGWMHAMKRSIGPGAQIPLDELYEQYGIKHDLAEGEEFLQWLRNVKLKDAIRWKIELQQEEVPVVEEPEEEVKVARSNKVETGNVAPPVPKEMVVADIVGLSVRLGREILPKVQDLNLLKYALQQANQLSGKDSLCRIIRKRIKDLQIAR